MVGTACPTDRGINACIFQGHKSNKIKLPMAVEPGLHVVAQI